MLGAARKSILARIAYQKINNLIKKTRKAVIPIKLIIPPFLSERRMHAVPMLTSYSTPDQVKCWSHQKGFAHLKRVFLHCKSHSGEAHLAEDERALDRVADTREAFIVDDV